MKITLDSRLSASRFDSFGPGDDMQLLGDTGGFSPRFCRVQLAWPLDFLDVLTGCELPSRAGGCRLAVANNCLS